MWTSEGKERAAEAKMVFSKCQGIVNEKEMWEPQRKGQISEASLRPHWGQSQKRFKGPVTIMEGEENAKSKQQWFCDFIEGEGSSKVRKLESDPWWRGKETKSDKNLQWQIMEGGGGGQTKMEKWSHTLGQGSRGVMRAAGVYLYLMQKNCTLFKNPPMLAHGGLETFENFPRCFFDKVDRGGKSCWWWKMEMSELYLKFPR